MALYLEKDRRFAHAGECGSLRAIEKWQQKVFEDRPCNIRCGQVWLIIHLVNGGSQRMFEACTHSVHSYTAQFSCRQFPAFT